MHTVSRTREAYRHRYGSIKNYKYLQKIPSAQWGPSPRPGECRDVSHGEIRWTTSDVSGSNKAKQGKQPPTPWRMATGWPHPPRACLPDDHLLIVVASAAVVPPITSRCAGCVDHWNVDDIGNLHPRLSFAAGVHHSHGPISPSADLRWSIGCLGNLADGCVEVAGRGE
jgi:hypothetical protein